MLENQQYRNGAIAVQPEVSVFPSYAINHSGRLRDRRIAGIQALLGGLHSVATVAHASEYLLHPGSAIADSLREIPYDLVHVPNMSGLMTAISHFGTFSNFPEKKATQEDVQGLKRSMLYVIGLSEDQFFGNQRRGLHAAKQFASQTARRPQHISTYLNVLTKHIHSLRSKVLSPYTPDNVETEIPRLPMERRTVPVSGHESLRVRGKLIHIITHDVSNKLHVLGLQQNFRIIGLQKLAKLSDESLESIAQLAEIERIQAQRKEGDEEILHTWSSLLEQSIQFARLMEEPYRRFERSAENWQSESERAAISLGKKQPQMEVRFQKALVDGNVVWADEWLHSLVENIGQNLNRIWEDAQALGLPQTKVADAHPILNISVRTDPEDFVMTFADNGTGFAGDYLQRGFQGQHGYISHDHSTGTAMKELTEMVKVYGGKIVLKNAYVLADGTRTESSDPNFAQEPSLLPVGGVIEVRLPLQRPEV